MRGTKGNTIVVDGSDQSFTITGLDPATQYMLRVAVVNQARFLLFLFFILMVFDDKHDFRMDLVHIQSGLMLKLHLKTKMNNK